MDPQVCSMTFRFTGEEEEGEEERVVKGWRKEEGGEKEDLSSLWHEPDILPLVSSSPL